MRISEEVKKELSNIIRELKDPRIPQMTSVLRVDVTPDLRYAKAHISIMGTEEEKAKAIEGLQSAAGLVRREIGSRLDLRNTPEFTFVSDNSIEYGAMINEMFKKGL
jgi:ribosome-binding factor A